MDRELASTYVEERRIPELFQSLTVALVYHRPDDPVQFLLDRLDDLQESGGGGPVFWDTFLPRSGGRRLDPIDPYVTRARTPSSLSIVDNTRKPARGPSGIQLLDTNHDPDTEIKGLEQAEKGQPRARNIHERHGPAENQSEAVLQAPAASVTLGESPSETTGTAELQSTNPAQGETDSDRKQYAKETESGTKEPAKGDNGAPDGACNNPSSVSPDEDGDDDDGGDDADQPDCSGQLSTNKRNSKFLERPDVASTLRGSFNDLPQMPSSTVRIFLSSTFSDFKAERNILPREAYPKLQSYCNEKGLDFQVVDLRWGVTDELINDHQVSELCIREIETCRQVSCGPNFVAFLGNRYGFRPFPSYIDAQQFDVLSSLAEQKQHAGLSLLKEWFLLDQNTVPPKYVLQPIDMKLPHYHDMSMENSTKQQNDKKEWDGVFDTLQDLLRSSAQAALEQKLISEEEAEIYSISVTENEIKHGLFTSSKASAESLCYKRQLKDIKAMAGPTKVGKFIDLENSHIDATAQGLLGQLLDSKIPQKVPEVKMRRYDVNWTGVPLEDSIEDAHLAYLHNFSQDFVEDMITLIANKYEGTDDLSRVAAAKELYLEVLHHAKFAVSKCEIFCGREEELNLMKDYIERKNPKRSPLIISGKSGYGKTALLAYAAKMIPTWFGRNQDVNMVVRFFGTSSESSNILNVLRSLISQMCAIYDWTVPPEDKLDKLGDVRRYFWKLMEMIQVQRGKVPLVLVLDSVDQLSQAYNAHTLTWLPRRLPKNIYLITSMLSDKVTCMDNAKRRFPGAECHMELEALSISTCDEVISTYLKVHGRSVTNDQRNLLRAAAQSCTQPLFLKLILDDAIAWHSYDPLEDLHVSTCVSDAISKLFTALEGKYGQVFVTHALGYLTSGLVGLTGVEMEDVLSCDDEVLNEVYKYHDPPLDTCIRIPSLMWARLEDELREYLAQRKTDGKTVLTWYHRQFAEAAKERYLNHPEDVAIFHKALSELYYQETGIKKTIILHQRNGKQMENADRGVSLQPLSARNIRKLNALPFHFHKAGELRLLRDKCLLNFDFLHTKLLALGISHLFSDYKDYAESDELRGDEEVELMCNLLEICYDALRMDPTLFAFNVKDRMGSLKTLASSCRQLVADAEKWITSTEKALLLPTHPMMFQGLDSPLKFSMLAGNDGCMSWDEVTMVTNWLDPTTNSNKIQVVDMKTKDVLASRAVAKLSPVVVTKDNEGFVFIENDTLCVCEIGTGDALQEVEYSTEKYENVTPRCITISETGKYVALGVRCGKPRKATDDNWKIQSFIFIVDISQSEAAKLQGASEDQDGRTHSTLFKSRKHVENLAFVDQDTKLLAFSKEVIHVYMVPEMENLTKVENVPSMHGLAIHVLLEKRCVVLGACPAKGAKPMVYHYSDDRVEFGPLVHVEDKGEDGVFVFGVVAKEDLSVVLMGTGTRGDVRASRLWLWKKDEDSAERIVIDDAIWKVPNLFIVTEDWKYAVVAWANGDLSVVNLVVRRAALNMPQAHGSLVSVSKFFDGGKKMVSLSGDHSLKIWDVAKFLQEADRSLEVRRESEPQKRLNMQDASHEVAVECDNSSVEGQTQESAESHKANSTNVNDNPADVARTLNPMEQCIDLNTLKNYVITASEMNIDGPKFWNVTDGSLAEDLTQKHNETYRASLQNMEFDRTSRMHTNLDVFGDYIFYQKKRRSCIAVYITKGIQDPKVISHQFLDDTFLVIDPAVDMHMSMDPECSRRMQMFVRNGALEIRDMNMNVQQSIEVPKITDDIGNLQSNNAKKKLMFYRVGVTFDGKYFLIVNPSASKTLKFFDLVDLKHETYVKRIKMAKTVNWKIMDHSFIYLAGQPGGDMEILSPSKMLLSKVDFEYKCLIYQEQNRLSVDRSLGLEFSPHHTLRVYQVDPLRKLHTLEGHIAEITCAALSRDNSYVASGSVDKTVRIWAVSNGQQLCMFNTYGSLCNVMFTPTTSHVVIHAYAAPQRKRAAILKIANIPSQ